MNYLDIYRMALAVLGEEEANCSDYQARALPLLQTFVQRAWALDTMYRQSHGLCEATEIEAVTLEDPFPLSARLAGAAACDLAAMLIGRENTAYAEQLHRRAEEELHQIRHKELTAVLHPIAGK